MVANKADALARAQASLNLIRRLAESALEALDESNEAYPMIYEIHLHARAVASTDRRRDEA